MYYGSLLIKSLVDYIIKESMKQGENKYIYWKNERGKLYLLHGKYISTIEKKSEMHNM